MKVKKSDSSRASAARAPATHSLPGAKSTSPGSPILEVFVRPQAASGPGAQRYLHQAVSLRLPTMEEVSRGFWRMAKAR